MSPHRPVPVVLLLEDDPALSRMLEVLLRRVGGWIVFRVESLSEALITAKRETPDFYLVDLYVSDGFGTGVLDAMEAGGLETKPVILLSAATDDPALLASQRAHRAQGVLSKPFDPETLVSQLLGILNECGNGAL